jgi:hypothetical protein
MKEDKNEKEIPEEITAIAEEAAEDQKKAAEEEKRKDLNIIATEFAIAVYGYAAHVKSLGHASLAEMFFKEAMTVYLSANMASDSIGKDRFIKFLDEGFYSSGRIIEYLKFSTLIGISVEESGILFEEADKIHRIFAASVRTATGKKPQAQVPAMAASQTTIL